MIELHRLAPLPPITHLHFLILDSLTMGELAGTQIRDQLRLRKAKRAQSAFYDHMKRLEHRGLVKGWYVAELKGEHAVRVRKYKITVAGRRAVGATYAFYADRALALDVAS